MKDQYFGDIHDFRKYGLIRALQKGNKHKLLLVWMLTPPNGKSNDGNSRKYYKNKKEKVKWCDLDSGLYNKLTIIADKRNTGEIKKKNLLPRTEYFPDKVPENKIVRIGWRKDILKKTKGKDLVFFDPDNGIEPPSGKCGLEHLAWEEIKMVWDLGCSILIYQNLRRNKKKMSLAMETKKDLESLTRPSSVHVFDAKGVLFFLVSQKAHSQAFQKAIKVNLPNWKDQIDELKL